MGKTLSSRRSDNNNNKFAPFNFDDDEEKDLVEKHAVQMAKKFKSIPPPIDKYTFLHSFSKENKDQDKKSGHEPIHIDATEEVVKGCASSLQVNVVSSSSDSFLDVSPNNHSARYCLSKSNSYVSRGPDVVGTSTNSNRRVATQYDFPLDRQLIGITSDDDDDDDSIELNSASGFNCHYGDNEALSAKRVRVYGFDGGEPDMAIIFLPRYIDTGNELFWYPKLTLTRNHVKLEAVGSLSHSGPLSCIWTVADIISIESVWFEKHSQVGLHLHLESKDAKLPINVEDSGIVKLNWEFAYPHWPELQNKIWALDDKFKDAWTTNSPVDAVDTEDVLMDKFLSHHFRDSGEFVEVTFPKGELDAVSICRSDIQLLKPRTFINDTIIDFYMKYLENQVKHKEVPQFHFFNSFFFRKLVDLDGDLSREHEGREAFLRVHKWTRKLNLFEKDYIFIPVNFSFHWSLIVICHPAEVANLKDEEMKKLASLEEKEKVELCKVPCILHMDSIEGSHRGLQKLFQGYLLEEWKERHNDLMVDISSRFWNVPFIDLKVPQQKNLFDCGLFLLHCAELFIRDAPENFNPYRIPKSSNFLSEHWFSPADASSKRTHIKDLIFRIWISGDHNPDFCGSDKTSPSESTEVDECNNSGQFFNKFCASTDSCLVNHSKCTAHQKFGTKPVVEAPLILQCDEESKLNDDMILDCRYYTRSPSDGYCHPARKYNQSKSIMSPIEEHEESEEQKPAMSYWDKELNATKSKLLPGISADLQEVEKQENLLVSGDQKSAILDLDVEDYYKKTEIYSTPSDESEKQENLLVSGDQKSATLDLDVEDYYKFKVHSTPSDEFAACVVEDSEEISETQDDDECQSSYNHQNKAASFGRVANSFATTFLPSEYMLNDGFALCDLGASEEKQHKTPGVKVDFGCPYQQGVAPASSDKESNFIEITDSVERCTPLIPDTEERMSAKRPRSVLLVEEEPLHKRFQTIVID